MGQVQATINGRSYRLDCSDGQEARLRELIDFLGRKVECLASNFGQVGDIRLLLMAALKTTDELFEVREQLFALEQRLAVSEQKLASSERQLAVSEQKLAASEQRLAASEQQLAVSEQQLVVCEQQRAVAERARDEAKEQARAAASREMTRGIIDNNVAVLKRSVSLLPL